MRVLQLLSDGLFHSGEALGVELGVSRTAIWKQISRWRKKGLNIDVVHGKGYRWRSPLEWWSAEKLLQHMQPETRRIVTDLQILQVTDSTNTVIYEQLRKNGRSGSVCLAEEQTTGRGRRGREWVSSLGSGLTGSIGWCFDQGVAALEGLSLAIGLSVVRALKRYGLEEAGLKWPNDIMLGSAKLGGILIELQVDGDGRCLVVVGIGLNIAVPGELDAQLNRPVTDVSRAIGSKVIERNRLGAYVIEEALLMLKNYRPGSFAELHEEWCRYDVLAGQSVEIEGGQETIRGKALGVDIHGALLIDTPSGMQAISSGEVSLRGI